MTDSSTPTDPASNDLHDRRRTPLAVVDNIDALLLYSAIVDGSDDAVFAESLDGQVLLWSRSAERVYGYTHEQAAGLRVDELVPADHRPTLEQLRRVSRQGLRTRHVEMVHQRRDGVLVDVSVTCSPIRDNEERVIGSAVIVRDITEQKRRDAELRHAAQHDKLTDLPNLSVFSDRLNRAIERKKRYVEHHYAVLFLDLDRFKIINDSLGHGVGNELLIQIADQLRASIRGVDTASRMGGDEFAVLLDGLNQNEDAVIVAERILQAVGKPKHIGGHEVIVTASIGIVTSDKPYKSADIVLRDADNAMYHAKGQGRNTYALFDEQMHEAALRRLELEKDLRKTMELDQLTVYYQPLVCLETGLCSGFEALVRWEHPVHGMIVPDHFIPLAEEIGLVHQMGEWVLEQAACQLRQWLDRFGDSPAMTMNVNVSRLQLLQTNLADRFCHIVDRYDLPHGRVKLEITESTIMDDRTQVFPALEELKAAGFGLAMDDFGTGHSSLSCLHRFPIDSLKIDRSFISSMDSHNEFLAVVRTIVTLAHALGIRVVAEGVESADQLAQLQALECDQAQGFFFARPMSPEHATRYLRESADDLEILRRSA